jgi:hypothetical protein
MEFIISTLYSEEDNTSFHLCLRTMHTTHGLSYVHLCSATGMSNSTDLLSHYVTQENHLEYHLNSLAQKRSAQHSSSVSDRNHIPISWAHPTHGLSLRSTQSIYVLEDISRKCNHQHSLSTREVFSTRPSLAWKYSNSILVVVINTPS